MEVSRSKLYFQKWVSATTKIQHSTLRSTLDDVLGETLGFFKVAELIKQTEEISLSRWISKHFMQSVQEIWVMSFFSKSQKDGYKMNKMPL